MNTNPLRAAVLATVLLAPSSALFPQSPGHCPGAGLSLQRAGDILTLRWDAGTGGTQLVWAPTLADDASIWQQVPNPVLTPGGEQWEAEFSMTPPDAFFRVVPANRPGEPPNVVLTVRDGRFVVEWDSTCDAAGYVIYVGENENVGPGDHVASFSLLTLTNCLEVVGLSAGNKYFVTVAATNFAGESVVAEPVTAVFGPQGKVTARMMQSFTLGNGEVFEVEAAGASLSLLDNGNPLAPPRSGVADQSGFLELRGVPDGSYSALFAHQGTTGLYPEPVEMSNGGVHVAPLNIAPQHPPQPAETLLGILTLSDGQPARADFPDFGVHAEAVLRAEFSDGSATTAVLDSRGRFALTNLPDLYPITLRGTFQGLEVEHRVQAPPADLAVIPLHFAEQVPQVLTLVAMQEGEEVSEIRSGVPVTVSATVDNPDRIPLKHFWVAEFNGERQIAEGQEATFTFVQPPGPQGEGAGDPLDSGLVTIRYLPSCLHGPILMAFHFAVVDFLAIGPCWSGMIGSWHPSAPDDVLSAHPATVKLTRAIGSPLNGATSLANGYFQLATFTSGSQAPFVLRAEKEGHMRFLWPFEHRLPPESQYCVVLAESYNADQDGASGIVINHPSGARLTLPNNSVKTLTGVNYLDTVVIEMVAFNPLVRHPLPPNPELRDGPNRRMIDPVSGVWFSLRTPLGDPLVTTSAATLILPVPPFLAFAQVSAYHQDESTAYFERWGYGGDKANLVGAGQYEIPLGTEGLFLIGSDSHLVEGAYIADRTLNYPFDVLVNNSIFPITVYGPANTNIGRLYLPGNIGVLSRVLDLRQAPGLHFPNPVVSTTPLSPLKKNVIVSNTNPVAAPPSAPPFFTAVPIVLSLTQSEPNLASASFGATSAALGTVNHFLSRGGVNTPAEAQEYYQKIQAPPTLSAWRSLNGFPARFGGPLPSVAADDYATVYYYNLGDLGFARAQTMRVRTSTVDGKPDVAFAVTNYRTLEDARCGKGAVATVCMDYAARADLGKTKKTRYTRFYVYGADNKLLDCADLDGAGLKYVPNLCVTCHGGTFFQTGNSTDLGSSFLPFDLEAYTYHPKFGVQLGEMAKMNAAVLKTKPAGAIKEVIEGWYGASDPLTNPLAFNHLHVPASWSTDPALYADVFKHSCRVCHISRGTGSSMYFDSYTAFQGFGFGQNSACSTLDMPHAQRTWGIFWGSRCAVKLGATIPDAPTLLGTAATLPCRSP